MSSVAEFALAPARRRIRERLPSSRIVEYVCVAVLGILVLVALLAPVIAPHDPNAVDPLAFAAGPSGDHLLGTDSSGRDLLSRLIHGARLSLLGPALVVTIATIAGTGLAVLAAWRGGWLDTLISRGFDVIFAFPGLLLAVAAVAMFGAGFMAPVLALSITYTPWIGRVVRAAAIDQRHRPYIAAAAVQGHSGIAICWRHLLPNILPIVVVQATLSFGYALVELAAVSFLGLGIQPPTSEWGLMVSTGQPAILEGNPAESLFAGAMIVLTVVAFNLLGERLATRSGLAQA
jgi:peptide/nickel transport system permease protein